MFSFRTLGSHLLWNLIEGLFLNFRSSKFLLQRKRCHIKREAVLRNACLWRSKCKSLFGWKIGINETCAGWRTLRATQGHAQVKVSVFIIQIHKVQCKCSVLAPGSLCLHTSLIKIQSCVLTSTSVSNTPKKGKRPDHSGTRGSRALQWNILPKFRSWVMEEMSGWARVTCEKLEWFWSINGNTWLWRWDLMWVTAAARSALETKLQIVDGICFWDYFHILLHMMNMITTALNLQHSHKTLSDPQLTHYRVINSLCV